MDAQATKRIYQEIFPQRTEPNVKTLIRLHMRPQKLMNLNEIERNSEISTLTIAHELNIFEQTTSVLHTT